MAAAQKTGTVRISQGLALAAGAVVLELVLARGDAPFYWTPLAIGLAYLAAAALGGRDGGHWATASVLCGWGLAVVWAGSGRPDLDISGLYLAGAGLGATAGLLLGRAGFDVDPLGIAATIAAAGLVLALAPQIGELEEARTYALVLGVVALLNLLLGARAERGATAT